MAHYSFLCGGCQKEYEVRCNFAESEAAVCPDCGSGEKRRVFKPVGVSVKAQGCVQQEACPAAGGCGCSGGACPHH